MYSEFCITIQVRIREVHDGYRVFFPVVETRVQWARSILNVWRRPTDFGVHCRRGWISGSALWSSSIKKWFEQMAATRRIFSQIGAGYDIGGFVSIFYSLPFNKCSTTAVTSIVFVAYIEGQCSFEKKNEHINRQAILPAFYKLPFAIVAFINYYQYNFLFSRLKRDVTSF